MKKRLTAFLNWLVTHPFVDWVAPLGLLAIWALGGFPNIDGENARHTLYTTTSAAAGIALAAATFTCGFLYSSSGELVQSLRAKYEKTIGSNWLSLLSALTIAVVLPIFALLLDDLAQQWAIGMCLAGLALMIISFARVIFWIWATLTVEDGQNHYVPVVETQIKNSNEWFE